MREVFTWQQRPGSQGRFNFRVREAQFGDGYTQVVADGINNARRSWPVQFSGTLDQMAPIRDFFERHQGAKAFDWTAPGDTEVRQWRVKDFSMQSLGGGIYSVSADFLQFFVP